MNLDKGMIYFICNHTYLDKILNLVSKGLGSDCLKLSMDLDTSLTSYVIIMVSKVIFWSLLTTVWDLYFSVGNGSFLLAWNPN
jgi:hypothetical protein